MRRVLAVVAALLLATPLAIIATFLLLPFWRWLETVTRLQAVGHASLAEWCFVVTWAVLAPPVALLAWRASRARPAVEPPAA